MCHRRVHTVFKVARWLGHNTQVWACGCWSPLCTLQQAESVSPHLFPVRTRGGLHNTQGDRRVKFMHTSGPLPPKWFSVRPCGGSLNTKIFKAKNKSILEQTNRATSPKTDVVPFQRLGVSGATHFKWSALLGKFWHAKMIVHWNDRSVSKILTH